VPTASDEPEVGDKLGPYLLVDFLGRGGMGIVFRAAREADGETVALKVLRQELAADDVYERRFDRERRIASALEHPNLLPIVDAGESGGRRYVAVRFVDGCSLAELLEAGGSLAVPELLRLAAEIGSALDALHGQRLVHRDVKPANVMLAPDGTAALTDFGLAKGDAYTVLTRPGQVMGTLDYLAPEVIKGGPASPASDVYAFGCVIFECLAGAPPFAGGTVVEASLAHIGEEPADPAEGREDAPAELGWAVRQALAKDPAERPRTATAYARLLKVST
jgi:serine/threonine-protein kinase